MSGRAFFLVYFLWLGYGVRYTKDYLMLPTFDIHTVGYLIIAIVYILFAIKQ